MNTTPLTPPPASASPEPPQPQATAPQESPRGAHPAGSAITVVTAIVGGIALAATGATAAFAAPNGFALSVTGDGDQVQTLAVDGITGLELDVDASNVRIEFGEVDEAELAVDNGRGGWTLERDGDVLVVQGPDFGWGWWFSGWFGEGESVVLTLPDELGGAGFDADLTLDAGSLDVSGDFGALDVEVNAGAFDAEGSATSLGVDMSAGRADVQLADVDEAALSVSAGDLVVELTGTAPTETTIDVSAGSADVTVPDVEYAITQDISAGSLDATIDQASSARRVIDVTLSAGSVTLRPGD